MSLPAYIWCYTLNISLISQSGRCHLVHLTSINLRDFSSMPFAKFWHCQFLRLDRIAAQGNKHSCTLLPWISAHVKGHQSTLPMQTHLLWVLLPAMKQPVEFLQNQVWQGGEVLHEHPQTHSYLPVLHRYATSLPNNYRSAGPGYSVILSTKIEHCINIFYPTGKACSPFNLLIFTPHRHC